MKNTFEDGFNNLCESYFQFFNKANRENILNLADSSILTQPQSANPQSAKSVFSVNDFIGDKIENPTYNEEVIKLEIQNRIGNEITLLLKVFKDQKFLNERFTSNQFWFKHENNFPYLSKLALALLNIPSSSAFIERFFSICGVICNKRSLNIGDDLLITRSLLKANVKLLNDLSNICSENYE